MSAPLSQEEITAVATVRDAVSIAVMETTSAIITPFVHDPAVSAAALMLGIAQSHVDGLASALGTLDPATRDPLIDAVPEQLRTIIERDDA